MASCAYPTVFSTLPSSTCSDHVAQAAGFSSFASGAQPSFGSAAAVPGAASGGGFGAFASQAGAGGGFGAAAAGGGVFGGGGSTAGGFSGNSFREMRG